MYWTLNLNPLMVYPNLSFPLNFILLCMMNNLAMHAGRVLEQGRHPAQAAAVQRIGFFLLFWTAASLNACSA